MKSPWLGIILFLFSTNVLATDEGQVRLGVQAGHVGLMGDAGGRAGNAVGFGGYATFFASDEMAVEVGLIQSSHIDLKHREIDVGVNYYWGSYDALYPHLALGVAFLNHTLRDATTVNTVDMDSSGFGLYAGLGAEVEVGRNLAMGLLAKYDKNFETTLKLGNGTSVKAIEDNVTVMFRLAFAFSGKSAN